MSNKRVLRLSDLHKKLGLTSAVASSHVPDPPKPAPKSRAPSSGLISLLPTPAEGDDHSLPAPAPPDTKEACPETIDAPADVTTKKRQLDIDVTSLPESKDWDALRANPHIEVKDVRQEDYVNEHWEEEYSRHIELERLKTQQTAKLVVTEKRRKINHIMALAEEAVMHENSGGSTDQPQQKSKRETGAKYGW